MNKNRIILSVLFTSLLLGQPLVAQEPSQATLNKKLHEAAFSGSVNEVRRLISKGAFINAKDIYGHTPLYTAVYKDHQDVVEFLISEGADVNVKDNAGETPLHEAAGRGRKEVAEFLISEGADVNAKNNKGKTPLYWAAFWGHKEVVEFLISKGADVNAKNNKGRTLLEFISEPSMKKFLISKGAKTGEELYKEKGYGGFRGVSWWKERLEQKRLEQKKREEQKRLDASLLEFTGKGDVKFVREAIEAGASVNVKDNAGETPLHKAARWDYKKVAELLISKGASVDAKDNKGETPLDVAWDNEIKRLLKDAGAKTGAELCKEEGAASK